MCEKEFCGDVNIKKRFPEGDVEVRRGGGEKVKNAEYFYVAVLGDEMKMHT